MRTYKDYELREVTDTQLKTWLRDESNRQIKKWGVQDRHLFEWLAWTTEEFGEFAQAINDFCYDRTTKQSIIREGIQTVTLLLKIIESVFFHSEELA